MCGSCRLGWGEGFVATREMRRTGGTNVDVMISPGRFATASSSVPKVQAKGQSSQARVVLRSRRHKCWYTMVKRPLYIHTLSGKGDKNYRIG